MENNDYVKVRSASDWTLVINVPELKLHKTWTKRGATYPIKRDELYQAYYTASVENLFRQGLLVTDDKEFLKSVGLMDEEGKTEVIELTDKLMMRLISVIPVGELNGYLSKLSDSQLDELGNFAITHYKDLQMSKVDILKKATGKNILKAIELYKQANQEG